MCGLAGIWAPRQDKDSCVQWLNRMLDSIVYRGPDSSGIWNENWGDRWGEGIL